MCRRRSNVSSLSVSLPPTSHLMDKFSERRTSPSVVKSSQPSTPSVFSAPSITGPCVFLESQSSARAWFPSPWGARRERIESSCDCRGRKFCVVRRQRSRFGLRSHNRPEWVSPNRSVSCLFKAIRFGLIESSSVIVAAAILRRPPPKEPIRLLMANRPEWVSPNCL